MDGHRNLSGNISKNPIFLALGAGLYPLIFYYSRNFGMVNSWQQFLYFVLLFLLLPLFLFSGLKWLNKHLKGYRWSQYIVPFFSVAIFLFFIKTILYSGIQKKMILAIVVISAACAYFLYRYLNRWVVIQLLLAVIGLFSLLPTVFKYLEYSNSWTLQADDIETATFTKRPNIYYIQPDGYMNSSQMKRGFYDIDNSEFQSFLADNHFKDYPNFRSNYITTLSSNSATFMMKHHYYHLRADYSEMLHARKNIISQNPVLSIFKKNGYKTHFLTEHPYLLVNRPLMGFDFSNFTYDEIPYITTGFEVGKDVVSDLKNAIRKKSEDGNFFFIEIFEPSHISTTQAASQGKRREREQWIEKLQIANTKLTAMVNLILAEDPDALIVIMADHGGFVGLDYTREVYEKTTNPDVIYSTFGTILFIRWPGGNPPAIDAHLDSSVNAFRILFSYLANNDKYLQHLQPDESYIILKKGTEPGVYEYIDDAGNIVCKPVGN